MPFYPMICKVCKFRDSVATRRSYDFEMRETIANGLYSGDEDDWAQAYTSEGGMECEQCGTMGQWNATIPVPEKHASWESTGKYGANGYFSKALGKFVDSPHVERSIMKEKGFVCEADLKDDWWQSKVDSRRAQVHEQEKYIQGYKKALDDGKTKEEAVSEVFNAQDAVSGKLEETFSNEKITLD